MYLFTHRTLTSARVKWVHLTSRLRSHWTWPVMETWLPSWVTSTSTLAISQNRCGTRVSSCGDNKWGLHSKSFWGQHSTWVLWSTFHNILGADFPLFGGQPSTSFGSYLPLLFWIHLPLVFRVNLPLVMGRSTVHFLGSTFHLFLCQLVFLHFLNQPSNCFMGRPRVNYIPHTCGVFSDFIFDESIPQVHSLETNSVSAGGAAVCGQRWVFSLLAQSSAIHYWLQTTHVVISQKIDE